MGTEMLQIGYKRNIHTNPVPVNPFSVLKQKVYKFLFFALFSYSSFVRLYHNGGSFHDPFYGKKLF